ncbi:putative colanic acid biosysnthesis UDP-glucose lipid carrier transferase [Microbulbifer donghaiensis]|uniref:Putative colanic acid biosysnthesis UDP-glucose lipid carrier transferase n=1 Tax=Microbulbifer donghaiensis TaxID=494016 RepID=A0A1M4ZYX1_9GAMM|nr:undecaprenyl-phosphate glucose phosphotransferase [Microbulbifer donghaiensis]SHF23198.1 putative colanic acid biosysnthesis UDP-glucose lipid carrier transferase [Microbulbifer donghaiensis]
MQQGWGRLHQGGIAALYRLLDGFLIFSALAVSLTIFDHGLTKDWLIVGLIAVTSFAFLAESVGLYRSWRVESYLRMIGTCLAAWIATCALLLLLGYFTKLGANFSRLVVGSWIVSTFSALAVWRFLARQLLFRLRARDRNIRTGAIIGMTEAGRQLAKDIADNPHLGIRILGFFRVDGIISDAETDSLLNDTQVIGGVEDAVTAARAGMLDHVYLALPLREEEQIREILVEFADTTATVHLLPNIFVANMLQSNWYQVGQSSLLSVFDTPIEGLNVWFKRLEDLVLATAILTLIAPLMAAIAVGIRLTSPGPAIFRQRRYGLDGRVIDVWKFRSMSVQENGETVVQAKRQDPRVTKFGRFLRRTSLDELPQLFNVLQGSMSIVGPRPHAVAHNEQYRRLVNGYMLRHKVKPGITGWAQINGWRGETDTVEKMARRVEHDLHYIRNWSILLDLRILMLTFSKGFISENSY